MRDARRLLGFGASAGNEWQDSNETRNSRYETRPRARGSSRWRRAGGERREEEGEEEGK